MKITLSKPLSYRDTELEELELDLDSLTGQDLIDIEESHRASGKNIQLFSQSYFSAVAAKSAHLPVEVINSLPLKDFTRITNQVIFFLSSTDSTDSPAENSEK